MSPRRRQPLTLSELGDLEASLWVDNACGLPCCPIRSTPKAADRVSVTRDSPRITRLVAEIDEAQAFRRTYIRPLPKEDE